MATLCVENSGDFFGFDFFVPYAVESVCSEDVHRIDGDDFYGACEVHNFGQGNGESQARETARADRNINMLNFIRFFAETVQQFGHGGEELGTVPHRGREEFLAK